MNISKRMRLEANARTRSKAEVSASPTELIKLGQDGSSNRQ